VRGDLLTRLGRLDQARAEFERKLLLERARDALIHDGETR